MDQFTLSFGETHHTESFTQFNVQNVTINQLTRSNSIDKLEIPDENVAVTRNGAISNCPIKSGIIINDANKQKVTGKLRQMLSNKENSPRQDSINAFLKRKEKGSYLRDISNEKLGVSTSCAKTNPLLAHQLSKKVQNSTSMNLLQPSNSAAESKIASILADKRELEKAPSSTKQQHSKKPKMQNEMTKNGIQEISFTVPKLVKEFSFKFGPTNTLTTSTPENKNFNMPLLAKEADSRVPLEEVKNQKECRIKKQPKKVEFSLATDTSVNDLKHRNSRKGSLKAQQDFADDLIRKGEEIKVKRRTLAETLEQSHLKHQAPRNSKQLPGRTFDDFLEEQNMFLDKKESRIKIAQLKLEHEKLVNEPTPIPVITQKAKNIIHKKENNPSYKKEVYQRLYEAARTKNLYHKTTSVPTIYGTETTQGDHSFLTKDHHDKGFFVKDSYTFHPQLESKSRNMKRGEKVENILYQDAIRRQHKSAESARSSFSIPNLSPLGHSSKLLIRKFLKEFEEEVNNFFEPIQDQVFSSSTQLYEFLVKIGFIRENHDTSSSYYVHDKCLVHTMWSILKGDLYNGVSRANLLTFLLAIMGLSTTSNSNTHHETPNGMTSPTNVIKTETLNNTEIDSDTILDNTSGIRTLENLNLVTMTSVTQRDIPKESIKPRAQKNTAVNSQNRISGSRKSNFGSTPGITEHTLDTQNNQETSLGISNLLTRKFSFQSDNLKTIETIGKEGHQPHDTKISFGTFDQKAEITFTEDEIHKISQTYDVFYYNRLYAQTPHINKERHTPSDLRFQPDILNYSRHLASKHREKQVHEIEGTTANSRSTSPLSRKVTHADILIHQGVLTESKLSKQRQENVERDLENCTFKPRTNSSANVSNVRRLEVELNDTVDSYHHRGERLYKLAASSTKSRVNRSHAEMEYERSAHECVFHPDIHRSKNHNSFIKSRPTEVSRDVEKSVERMKKGREQREHIRKITEKRAYSPKDENLPRFCFTLEKQEADRKLSTSFNKQPAQAQKRMSKEGLYEKNKNHKSVGRLRRINPFTAGFDSKGKYDGYTSFKRRERENTVTSFDESQESLNRSSLKNGASNYGSVLAETYKIDEKLMANLAAKNPILFIDVNFGGPRVQRIVVYEGDTAEKLANRFALKNNLNDHLRGKLQQLLQGQMSGILTKIDEEMQSLQSEIEKVPCSIDVSN